MQIFIESEDYIYIYAYGAPSKGEYFCYSNSQVEIQTDIYGIKLDDPLKDIQIEEGENYYVALYLSSKTGKPINLTVKYYNNPIEDFYESITEQYAEDVITNLASIIQNNYIYKDIAKNPPEPDGTINYTHPPIDIVESINNINTKDRKFYEFFQEIKEIIAAPRDQHFNIIGLTTPNGISFDYMSACLPFSFYVEKDKNETAKIYIKYYQDCAMHFEEKIKKKVEEKANNNIPLVKINGQDPFDYIQNWGKKYRALKNPHAHFTFSKKTINAFYLRAFPYSYDDLKMEFIFDDEEILKLDYYIYIPNFREMNRLLGSNILSEKEFDQFYKNEIKKNINNVDIPNIFEMIKKYKKSKGIIIEEENSKIEWDIETPEEKGIKCRVDHKNQINVILQQSFLSELQPAENIIEQCSRLFHENNYSVVIIENQNGGGNIVLSNYLSQLMFL